MFRAIAKVKRLDLSPCLWVTIALILVFLIAGPLFYLVKESIFVPEEVGLIEVKGSYGFGNYIEAYTNKLYHGPILWTVIVAFSVGVISLLIGSVIAWAVARTDVPYPYAIRIGALLSFVTPPFLSATAWVILAGPRGRREFPGV